MIAGGVNGNPEVCGAMTGGGSESILTMMKACRDYSRYVKGIRKPEVIIGDSAHAAYFKGAEYFKIKLVAVPVGPDYRLSGRAVRRAVTRNTILVIASAPGFPHGVVDHIEDIAKVDCCPAFPIELFLCQFFYFKARFGEAGCMQNGPIVWRKAVHDLAQTA